MKQLLFTYDISETTKDNTLVGETAMIIELSDQAAAAVMEHRESKKDKRAIDMVIKYAEVLKGREYIKDSIKSVEEIRRR